MDLNRIRESELRRGMELHFKEEREMICDTLARG